MAISASDALKNSSMSLSFQKNNLVSSEEFQKNEVNKAAVIQKMSDASTEGKKGFTSSLNEDREKKPVDITEEQVKSASQTISQLNIQLSFELSEEGDQNVVLILDKDTGDVVRQLPSEEFLEMSKRIEGLLSEFGEEIKGTLLNNLV